MSDHDSKRPAECEECMEPNPRIKCKACGLWLCETCYYPRHADDVADAIRAR